MDHLTEKEFEHEMEKAMGIMSEAVHKFVNARIPMSVISIALFNMAVFSIRGIDAEDKEKKISWQSRCYRALDLAIEFNEKQLGEKNV